MVRAVFLYNPLRHGELCQAGLTSPKDTLSTAQKEVSEDVIILTGLVLLLGRLLSLGHSSSTFLLGAGQALASNPNGHTQIF